MRMKWHMAALYLLLFCMAALAMRALLTMIVETSKIDTAWDLYPYWHSGLFVRQQADPYAAYLEQAGLEFPIQFVDRRVDDLQSLSYGQVFRAPAITPVMVLLISTLSFFSWPFAKFIWLAMNLVLVFGIPYLILQLLPGSARMRLSVKILLFVIFISLLQTRQTVVNGQTGLLVFGAMLLSLFYVDRKPWLAGIALGLALSKYSLALPLALLLLLNKRFRVLFYAFLTQLFGLLLLSLLTHQSPIMIVLENVQLLLLHAGQPGIHLASLFSYNPQASMVAGIMLSLLIAAVLVYGTYVHKPGAGLAEQSQLVELAAFGLLMCWALLVAYHREYDVFVVILPLATGGYLLANNLCESRFCKYTLAGVLLAAILILNLPGPTILTMIPGISAVADQSLRSFQDYLVTFVVLGITGLSIWIYSHASTNGIIQGI